MLRVLLLLSISALSCAASDLDLYQEGEVYPNDDWNLELYALYPGVKYTVNCQLENKSRESVAISVLPASNDEYHEPYEAPRLSLNGTYFDKVVLLSELNNTLTIEHVNQESIYYFTIHNHDNEAVVKILDCHADLEI